MPRIDESAQNPTDTSPKSEVKPQAYPVPVVIKDTMDYLEKFIDPKLDVIIRLLQELKK